ncbi:heat stress transcription factor B-4-like protein [Tanacetum coccineum]|uniref:Heat stress transcription factor B-4-like protein n=1 Tax=Tanacetum coccineum TaxID=301880 RepID=A0ABQ4WYT9_9ASTR
MEAPPSTVDGHHQATHRTTRIDLWYPGRMYVSGRVDIFDMVDINLFTVVALKDDGTQFSRVSTQVPIVAEVSIRTNCGEDDEEDAEQGNGQEDESAPTDGQFFYNDEGIDTVYATEYDVQSSEDTCTNDDDDVDEDFLVNEENEIVELYVDVQLFDERPWCINGMVSDSDPGNDEERNYRKRRLAELRTEMKGVINASGQWKYSFYTGQKFITPKEAKDRVYLHSIKSRRNLKLYKNQGAISQAKNCSVGLDSNNGIYPLAYALVEAERKSSMCWFLQCLGDDIDMHPNSNFTFISDRQKGIIPAIKAVYPSVAGPDMLTTIHEKRSRMDNTLIRYNNLWDKYWVKSSCPTTLVAPKHSMFPVWQQCRSSGLSVLLVGDGGAGVASKGISHIDRKEESKTEIIRPTKKNSTQLQGQPYTSSQVASESNKECRWKRNE